MVAIGEQPFCRWQAIQQGRRTGVVAHLACDHEEAERAALNICDGMQLGVHAALGATDQTSPLVARTPFFDRGLVVVRCAFR